MELRGEGWSCGVGGEVMNIGWNHDVWVGVMKYLLELWSIVVEVVELKAMIIEQLH